jgi:DNA polymerase-3 subunit delta
MTAVRPGDLARFRSTGWKEFPVVLLHGSDEGAIRELSASLVAAACGPDADPMNHIVLDGDTIAQDPPRLADELQTFALFGGRRVIHVRGAHRTPPAVVEAAADSSASDSFLVLEAGELKAGVGLRALADKHRRIASIACYADTTRSLQQLIDEVLGAHKLAITPDARVALAAALGADRALSRSEVEKLALYAQGQDRIDIVMVHDIVSDAGRHDAGALLDQAFAGQIAPIETEANRLFASGTNPSGLLSQAISHVLLLRRAARAQSAGATPDTIARQSRIHFSRIAAFERALSLWTEVRLDRALRIVSDAAAQNRKSARLSETIAIRALWAVSRLARNDSA